MKVVFLCKDSHKTMETVCNIIPPQSTADYHLIGLFAHESVHRLGPRLPGHILTSVFKQIKSGSKIINIIDEETEREKWVETKWISWKSSGLFYSQKSFSQNYSDSYVLMSTSNKIIKQCASP